MNIKRNIVFALEKRKKKKDGVSVVENVPIRMRVIYHNKRIVFTTGHRIDVSKWDESKQRVKNGCTNKIKQSAAEINSDLLKYYSDIQDIFKEFEVNDIIPNPEQLKAAFNNRQNKDLPNSLDLESQILSLMDKFDEFVRECGIHNNWTEATYEKLAATKKHLAAFDKNLSFEALDEGKLTQYVHYLRDKKGFRNSTIGKQIGFLKWFLRWSKKKGYTSNFAFELFKPKLKTTQKKVIFLTWAELTKLREYKIPETKKYMERVRDVFLFQCFTGLRYSDVFNLRRSDVKENHIEITTVKTADSLIIELNNHSKAILDKYKEVHFEYDKVALVQKNNPKKTNKKQLLPKEKAEVEFKINEKEKVSFTINSIVKNKFTTPVQPKKIHFKSYSFDKVSYILLNYSQKNIGFVKKGKSIEITSVFKVRPPPFIQNI